MSTIEQKSKNANSKKAEKGFSTALLLNISPFGENFKEPLEGVENMRLNTSACAAPNDNNSFMNDFLSFDLLQRIDAESPTPNQVKKEAPPDQKIPDVNIEKALNDMSEGYSSGNGDDDNDSENSDIILNQEDKDTIKEKENNPTKNQILNQLDQQQKNFVHQQQGNFNNRNPIPLYSYYDSTSKYLSQSMLDEKSKEVKYNQSNNNPMMNFNNMNQMGMNFIHKNMNNEDFFGNKMNNQFTYPYQNSQMRGSGTNMNSYLNQNQMSFPQEMYFDNSMPQKNFQPFMNKNILPPNMQNMQMNNNTKMLPQKKKGDSGNNLPHPNEQSTQKKDIKDDDYVIEMFGRVGWICDQCNNFNYDTRNKCNRCGIPKSPKKISKLKRKLENKKKEQMKMQQAQQKKTPDEDDKKKKLKERKGDWTCSKCGNLNFSFRIICNRCQLPKKDSDMMTNNQAPMNIQFNNQMNDKMVYNYNINQQVPMQFINNGQIYCNNLNVFNQNNMNSYQNKGNNIEGGELGENVNEDNN